MLYYRLLRFFKERHHHLFKKDINAKINLSLPASLRFKKQNEAINFTISSVYVYNQCLSLTITELRSIAKVSLKLQKYV